MSSLSFSACGGFMATGGRDQVVCVWDLTSLKAVQTVLALVRTANTARDHHDENIRRIYTTHEKHPDDRDVFFHNVKWVLGTHFMWTKTFAGYTFVVVRLKF